MTEDNKCFSIEVPSDLLMNKINNYKMKMWAVTSKENNKCSSLLTEEEYENLTEEEREQEKWERIIFTIQDLFLQELD